MTDTPGIYRNKWDAARGIALACFVTAILLTIGALCVTAVWGLITLVPKIFV